MQKYYELKDAVTLLRMAIFTLRDNQELLTEDIKKHILNEIATAQYDFYQNGVAKREGFHGEVMELKRVLYGLIA